MIWEGEPEKESVAKLEAIGVKSLVFDPCGNVPDGGNFLSVMKANGCVSVLILTISLRLGKTGSIASPR
ncbi:MAG: hypothetical protein EBU80_13370 [Chitinophagia bacterium]|nr:hypothetical protein [Chitinophagia bacterium]